MRIGTRGTSRLIRGIPLTLTLFFLMGGTGNPVSAAQAIALRWNGGSSLNQEAQVSLSLSAELTQPVTSFSMTIRYDQAHFTLVKAEIAPIEGFDTNIETQGSNTLTFKAVAHENSVLEAPTSLALIGLRLKAIKSGVGLAEVTESQFANKQDKRLDVAAPPACLVQIAPEVLPTASTTEETSASETPESSKASGNESFAPRQSAETVNASGLVFQHAESSASLTNPSSAAALARYSDGGRRVRFLKIAVATVILIICLTAIGYILRKRS